MKKFLTYTAFLFVFLFCSVSLAVTPPYFGDMISGIPRLMEMDQTYYVMVPPTDADISVTLVFTNEYNESYGYVTIDSTKDIVIYPDVKTLFAMTPMDVVRYVPVELTTFPFSGPPNMSRIWVWVVYDGPVETLYAQGSTAGITRDSDGQRHISE